MNLQKFYSEAEVASPTQWFHLYAEKYHGRSWELPEHVGRNWLEVFHIASNYNKDADEVFYYVGGIDAEPVAPSYEEVHEVIQRSIAFKRPLTAYEDLMINILFGVQHE